MKTYTIKEAANAAKCTTDSIRRIRRKDKDLPAESHDRFFEVWEWRNAPKGWDYDYSVSFEDGEAYNVSIAATAWIYRGRWKSGLRVELIRESLPYELREKPIKEIVEVPRGDKRLRVGLTQSAVDKLTARFSKQKKTA